MGRRQVCQTCAASKTGMCECHPFGVQASPPLLDSPSRRVPPRRLRLISLEDMTDDSNRASLMVSGA
jgi:hypothetical protein